MTHDDAFLQDIIESPGDDTPRLVYADWLEDQGQPDRAAFIRVQIELARLRSGERRLELEARERALLKEHEQEWARLPTRVATEWTFERGFLAGLKMPAKGFSRLREVFASCPTVQQLHLAGPFKNGKPSMQAIASSPHLARLTSLVISEGYYHVGPKEVGILGGSEYVASLTSLSLHNNAIGEGGLSAVAGSPHLSRLTSLSLSCWGFHPDFFVGVEDVQALATSPYMRRLTTLRLARYGLVDEACELLIASDSLASLRTLDLCNNAISDAMKARLQTRFGDRVSLAW
jgi:uncharacterized protein (TIGR02996 family)